MTFTYFLRQVVSITLGLVILSACGDKVTKTNLASQLQPNLNNATQAYGQSMSGNILYHSTTSAILGGERSVFVYLPPSYLNNPDKQYPVLYAMDGQNLFEKGTAAGGVEWRLDETVEQAVKDGKMKEIIIVAVFNGGEKRTSEYSHVPYGNHGGGDAVTFAKFLTEELKPQIDERYRTLKDRSNTAILGSSMGGLFSLYALYAHGNVFGRGASMSPSLWWAKKDIIFRWRDKTPNILPERVVLTMGGKETDGDYNNNGTPDSLDHARWLSSVFVAKISNKSVYKEYLDGAHNEIAWANQTPEVITSLFPVE